MAENIADICYFKPRFGGAIKKLVSRYPDGNFVPNINEALQYIVEFSKNPSDFKPLKSSAFLNYYMEENPSFEFGDYNPFYVLHFAETLPIHLIYVLLDECRSAGVFNLLFGVGKEITKTHSVCVFDLFDSTAEVGFCPIKPEH